MEQIGLGGGCHWCTEAVFDMLRGVERVEQGWIAAKEAESMSEGVILHFDPEVMTLELLIEIHLLTHSSTTTHSMRHKYRSGIYVFDKEQFEYANRILKEKQQLFQDPLITRVYTFSSFRLNDKRYLHYYQKNGDRPLCKNYIEPKWEFLKARYPQWIEG